MPFPPDDRQGNRRGAVDAGAPMDDGVEAFPWNGFGKLGHEVKLVPPVYVKPFVKTAEE